jgi:hypothetical protein
MGEDSARRFQGITSFQKLAKNSIASFGAPAKTAHPESALDHE